MHVLWNGIRYRWRLTSHRLAKLGTSFDGDSHELMLKIGQFPQDVADYSAWFTRLEPGDSVRVATGIVGPLEATTGIGQVATVRSTVTVPASAGADPGGAALLGGFRVRSVGNSSGWHFGRLAISLGPLRAGPEGLQFDVDVTLRPSEAPEALHLGNRGWSYDMPCVYAVEVDWVVVAGDIALEERRWETAIHRGLSEERTEELRVARPEGAPKGACAAALRAFDLEVGSVAAQRRRSRILRYFTGRNVRELGLWVELAHDDRSGVTELRPGIAFSNRAALPLALPALISLFVVAATIGAVVTEGHTRLLFAVLAAGLVSFGLAWPGGPLALPSVPWSLRAVVDTAVLYLPAGVVVEPGVVRSEHRAPDEPHTSEVKL